MSWPTSLQLQPAAIDLGLFTAIGERGQTADQIAETCQASVRGIRILCDYLVVNGFMHKQSGIYTLTPDTVMFLDSRSPAYLGGQRTSCWRR